MSAPTINGRRFASISSALVVAAIAAVASYSHMRHLAIQYGQDKLIATLLPVSVDGMLVVATIALGDGRRYRWSAWLAFWVGVVASVIANVLAAEPSAIARCISAWPAVAFLLVVEVITRGGIRTRETAEQLAPVAAEEVPAVEPEPAPEPVVDDMPSDVPSEPHPTAIKISKLRKRYPRITQQKVAERLDISVRTAARHWDLTAPVTEPVNGSPVPELVEQGAPT